MQTGPADPELLGYLDQRLVTCAGQLHRTLAELGREGYRHDGHPSSWPRAATGQVSGLRGQAQSPCAGCATTPTHDYVQRRTKQGLSKKEIIRCLKRYIVREVHTALLADFAALNP